MGTALDYQLLTCKQQIRRVIIKTVTDGEPSGVPERTIALLATLVDELLQATAAANVLCGGNQGSALVRALLEPWQETVRFRTLAIRHAVDEMSLAEEDDGASPT